MDDDTVISRGGHSAGRVFIDARDLASLRRNFLRNIFQRRNLKSFLAIGLGALPWILGLSIASPLGLTDENYGINSHHLEALYIVSVILPASCTLILTIIIIRQRLPVSRLRSPPSQENLVPPSAASDPTSPPDAAPVSVAVSPDEVNCVLDPTTEVHNNVHPVHCGNVLQGGADHHSPDADQFRSPSVNNEAPVSAIKQDLVQDDVISDQHPIVLQHQPLNIQQ
ncbi:hypothetical protein Btru_072036 [Bulinus truncatus]|nr:hypothetical protein Btru_072036 [Bulinus truncatus]